MDDFAVGMLVCGGPILCLGVVAVVAMWIDRGALRRRLRRLEEEMAMARSAFARLEVELGRLEAPPGAVPAPVASVETRVAAAMQPEALPERASVAAEAAPKTDVGAPERMRADAGEEAAPERMRADAGEEAAPEVAPADTNATPAEAARAGANAGAEAAPPEGGGQAEEGAASPPPAESVSPAPPSTTPAEPARPAASLEQWLGVRGAAALGAGVLVLAGLYFFQYSIEHGLVTPLLRVVIGAVVGVTCLAAAELWLRRRYVVLANLLSGAGVAILYLAFWAGSALYALIAPPFAFALMVLVTLGACLLALRRRSMAIAVLGLLGGFATPALLSTGADRPVALFSYLLVLDTALLFLARARRWSVLALLSLLGTTVYEALWIGGRMSGQGLALGIGILLVFGVLFAAAARPSPEGAAASTRPWSFTRVAAVLLPFLFALDFGLRSDLGPHLWPIGLYDTILVLGACVVGRRDGARWLGLAGACAALGTLVAWLFSHGLTLPLAWEIAAVAVVVGVVLALFEALDVDHGEPVAALSIWALGIPLATAVAAGQAPPIAIYPWLVAWLVLGALVHRVASRGEARASLHPAAAVVTALAIAIVELSQAGSPAFFPPHLLIVVPVAVALAWQLSSFLPHAPRSRRLAARGAALLALILLLCQLWLSIGSGVLAPALFLGGALALALLACLPSVRFPSGGLLLTAALAVSLVDLRVADELASRGSPARLVALVFVGLAFVAFVALPFLLPAPRREEPAPYRVAALAGAGLFPAALELYRALFGEGTIGLLPIGFGALAFVGLLALSIRGPRHPAARHIATVWLAGAALGFVVVAVPVQVHRQWITIGWALVGGAMLVLWRRYDHVGLKYFALALLALVTVRLVLDPAVLGYAPRGPLPVLNWLAYTYLVPAGALLGSFLVLTEREVPRLRKLEKQLVGGRAVGAAFVATCALLVVFVWINLAIIDAYTTGPDLRLPVDRMPARDLTMSVAWALYGIGLLALGLVRRSTALRFASLGLMLLTSGKVFLYDLAQLQDLYRVASLVGLALSLIVISLAYQRFVFARGDPPAPPTVGAEAGADEGPGG